MTTDADNSDVPRVAATRRWLPWLAIFALALLIRGAYLWGLAGHNPLFHAPDMDARVHHEWAHRIATGEAIGQSAKYPLDQKPYFRAPLYYHLLGYLYKVVGPNVSAGRIAGALLGSGTCVLIALLARLVAGSCAGWIAGLLAALYWPFVYFDGELLTVGLEVFFDVALLLLCVLAVRRQAVWLFFMAGIIWGLSAITRPNVLALAPGLIVWLWFVAPRARRWRSWLSGSAVLGLGAAIVIAPVTIRNYRASGEFVLIASQGGVNFYIGNNPKASGYAAILPGTRAGWWEGFEDTHEIVERALGREPSESEVSRFWFDKAFAWIRAEPIAWLKLLALKFALFWSWFEIPNNQPVTFFARQTPIGVIFWIGFPIVAMLGVAGFVFQRENWRSWSLLLIFLLIYMATVIAFFCPAHYRLPIVPVLIVAAAAGLAQLPTLLKRRQVARLVAYMTLAVVVRTAIAFTPPHQHEGYQAYEASTGYRMMALACRTRAERTPEDIEEALGFYAAALQSWTREVSLHHDYATLLLEADRPLEALPLAERWFTEKPGDLWLRRRLARGLLRGEHLAEAAAQYAAIVTRQPGDAAARGALAQILLQIGRAEEALPHLRRVLADQPEHVRTRVLLADALRKARDYEQALAVIDAGFERNAEDPSLLLVSAWLRATSPCDALRDAALALEHAVRAESLSARATARIGDTLAAAHARAGEFEEAVAAAERALMLVTPAEAALAREIRARLRLYEQGRPYRAP